MAIPANFFHAGRSSVKNQRTGYRSLMQFALASWFTTIAEPASAAVDAAAKTSVGDHVFATGFGFIDAYALPNSVSGDGESSGDEGASHLLWKPKFFLPGDHPALQNMVEEQLMNADIILLVKDINCPDGGVRQFGCDCNPVTITSCKFVSGTKNDGKKGWEIEASSACRFFYPGAIVKAA